MLCALSHLVSLPTPFPCAALHPGRWELELSNPRIECSTALQARALGARVLQSPHRVLDGASGPGAGS